MIELLLMLSQCVFAAVKRLEKQSSLLEASTLENNNTSSTSQVNSMGGPDFFVNVVRENGTKTNDLKKRENPSPKKSKEKVDKSREKIIKNRPPPKSSGSRLDGPASSTNKNKNPNSNSPPQNDFKSKMLAVANTKKRAQ